MPSYICLTYARANSTEAERLADTLTAYGFRVRRIHEESEPSTRSRFLGGAALVLALTSPEAHEAETVTADLRRLPPTGRAPICISLGENPIDERFCRETTPGASDRRGLVERIPYPTGDTPDAHAVGLFLHRLLIHRLARMEEAFSASRCRRDIYGRQVLRAVAAHAGDGEAAYALGCAYERGEGVPILEAEAALWITRAAEAGLPNAKLHLGELCLCGWGVEPDEDRAFALFSEVADTGDVRGEYRLGLCFLNGVGVVADPVRAVYHLRRAARWGYPPALFRLGLLLRDGVGTAPNAREALHDLYEACRRGAAVEAAQREAETDRPDIDILTPLFAAEEETESDAIAEDPALLQALSDLASPAEENEVLSPAAAVFPLPPSLYDARTERVGVRITMRHLRARRLLRTERSATAARSTPFLVTAAHRPEKAWIGSLTRQGHATAPGGGQASGHPALYMDRDDVAMGVPFALSDAAVALAGLLESGSEEEDLLPDPTRALVWYRYALRRGNTEALYRLANAYRRGHGTLPDPAWAVVLYRLSADWSDARGQFALAVACERGIGTETDIREAVRRYEQAATAGYAPAANNLGGCYEYGIGVSQNILTAVEWYVRAADAGLPEAMCRLALCCECGRGVSTDTLRAFELYRKAADLGNAYAAYRLGVCCDLGHYPLPDEQDGVADVSHTPRPARPSDAIRYWKTAALGGVAEASYALAMCYAHGHGVRPDPEQAIHFLREAADGDCLQAVYRLGMCYYEGNGVVRNTASALEHLRRAANLWRTRRTVYLTNAAPLPLCAHAPAEAAGDALYMLGYLTREGFIPLPGKDTPETRAYQAALLFSEAVEIGHVGASVAIGDLYAHGLLSAEGGMDNTQAARLTYKQAVRMSAARRASTLPLSEDDAEGVLSDSMLLPHVPVPDKRAGGSLASGADALSVSSVPALLSLAGKIIHFDFPSDERPTSADTPAKDASDDEIPHAWSIAWRYFAAAAEQGSADAHIAMARCTYYGLGTKHDAAATLRFLQLAEQAPGGRIAASLFLGDFYRTGRCGERRLIDADNAYLRGLSARPTGSEVGPYVMTERKEERLAPERQSRAEVLYRLATFRAVYFSDKKPDDCTAASDGVDRAKTFPYLSEAVLLGHTAAWEDLARMYHFEHNYPAATAPAKGADGAQEAPRPRLFGGRRKRKKKDLTLRDHDTWLSDYYTALWPEPSPFVYRLCSVAVPEDVPAHITAVPSPAMMATALTYLGDCYFEGRDLPVDSAAAVHCFRIVTEMSLPVSRGEQPPRALAWAQYSLGWCLLYGVGTARDEREAVVCLTAASRTHAEANFLLGECHEKGIGVDRADPRESLKYYRRAQKLGYAKADAKVHEIEAVLRERVGESTRRGRAASTNDT